SPIPRPSLPTNNESSHNCNYPHPKACSASASRMPHSPTPPSRRPSHKRGGTEYRVERSRSGSLCRGCCRICRVVGRMHEVEVPCTRLRDLRWTSRRCFSPEEIQHGTVTRPDGARPEAEGTEPLHAAELLGVLPQVRRVLHALAGGVGCRR